MVCVSTFAGHKRLYAQLLFEWINRIVMEWLDDVDVE
jgi:uncharacterized membrane protein YjdF